MNYIAKDEGIFLRRKDIKTLSNNIDIHNILFMFPSISFDKIVENFQHYFKEYVEFRINQSNFSKE